MKKWVVVLLLLLSFGSRAQVFHISDSSAILVKTTNQSPAHWYIEVYSECAVDTVLRWKATHFDNIPPEWEILLDDQTVSHSTVEVGDSADFNLLTNQPFATKLIIGAVLNETPGHGICYFDVYDPANPTLVQTISYEFIVTTATNGISNLNHSFLEWKDGIVRVEDGKDAVFEVFDGLGKSVRKELTNQFEILYLPKNQLFLIQVTLEGKVSLIKIFN